MTEELEDLLRDVSNPQEGQKYTEMLIDLQELIHFKHSLTSEDILKVQKSQLHKLMLKHYEALCNCVT